MTIQTFTPPIPPSSIRKRPKLKLLRADFGDGYQQIARDGLNHIQSVLELTWDVLTAAQAKAITDFFELHGGDKAFTYEATKFTCATWEDNTGRAGLHSIIGTFEQSFALS
jgi:phage-related protein